ncbi:hypothetical protein PRIPAC_73177 [Pristionchus pacificus]|uniref:Uncharacterized protein n=1 Tax=Pristionchus pacificus TaxID=54126 RepID=A0A2A6C8E0_PRIPA|nr:hypothetical protein PRIPAC_73177 [Pristionchus pacificus]|eukprot:PDM74313.1 hypothetical protein PRIPAC_41669 [Pristionchus pacificus]
MAIDSSRSYSCSDLFSTRQLSLYSLVMILSALTIEISVAIIIFDVQVLTGNPFVNIAMYGALRYCIELFPTVIRGVAVGSFGVVEKIGGAIAPQLIILSHQY